MEVIFYGKWCEYGIIDKCRAEISQYTWTILPRMLEKETCYHIIEHSIAEKFQSLKNIITGKVFYRIMAIFKMQIT